jgi:hypothetical protein
MIATTLLRRSAPRLAKDILARQSGSVMANQVMVLPSVFPWSPITAGEASSPRAFSTLDPTAVVTSPSGTVSKKFRVLNVDVVKNILSELKSVDVNHDGR